MDLSLVTVVFQDEMTGYCSTLLVVCIWFCSHSFISCKNWISHDQLTFSLVCGIGNISICLIIFSPFSGHSLLFSGGAGPSVYVRGRLSQRRASEQIDFCAGICFAYLARQAVCVFAIT